MALNSRVRVMMIGPYPTQPDRIDGGVAAATMYLSEALVSRDSIELVGVRVSQQPGGTAGPAFRWPMEDLPLGRFGLATLYRRQRKRLLALLHKHRPHVLHAQGADIAGFLAVESGLPTVVTIHGLLGACARYQSNAVARMRATLAAALTERRTVRRASHLIAISPYVTAYYRRLISGHVFDIPNAISPRFFRTNRKPMNGRILYAGRIAHGKGLPDLLAAVSKSRDRVSQLVLAGATPDPGYELQLRREIDRLSLSRIVNLVGLLDEASLIGEFEQATALILPSYQETAPMVVQQAMAAGLPVIANRVGGVPNQILHEVAGLLVDIGDIEALAGAIRSLTDSPEYAERLGVAAKHHAMTHFSAEAIAEATSDVYRAMAMITAPRVEREVVSQ